MAESIATKDLEAAKLSPQTSATSSTGGNHSRLFIYQTSLTMPSSEPTIVNRLTCPFCDNDSEFFEIAEDALVTTYFKQNQDCSFTASEQNTEILGSVRLFCGNCGEGLDDFHERFREMTF